MAASNIASGRQPADATKAPTDTSRTTFTARRVLMPQDFLNVDSPLDREMVFQSRAHAATRFHLELSEAKVQLDLLNKLVAPVRLIPTKLVGRVMQPDGTPGARLQVEFDVPTTTVKTVRRTMVTDSEGDFTVSVPAGVPFPSTNRLSFTVRGSNRPAEVTVQASAIAINGLMGNLTLPVPLDPLPVSIVQSLVDLLPDAWVRRRA